MPRTQGRVPRVRLRRSPRGARQPGRDSRSIAPAPGEGNQLRASIYFRRRRRDLRTKDVSGIGGSSGFLHGAGAAEPLQLRDEFLEGRTRWARPSGPARTRLNVRSVQRTRRPTCRENSRRAPRMSGGRARNSRGHATSSWCATSTRDSAQLVETILAESYPCAASQEQLASASMSEQLRTSGDSTFDSARHHRQEDRHGFSFFRLIGRARDDAAEPTSASTT